MWAQIVLIPICGCKPFLEASVTLTHDPNIGTHCSELQREELTEVRCGDCGKMLKPYFTIGYHQPDGTIGVRTVPVLERML